MGEISENALQGILGGLRLAGERKARLQHTTLEREKLSQEAELEKQRREQRAQEHKDIVEHQNAQLDLQKAAHKVLAIKERQNILQGHVEKGLPLTPGSGLTSLGEQGGQETIRQEGEPSATAVGNVPFTDIQVPTQQAFAQKAAQSLMELNAPKIELEHEKAKDLLNRQLQVEGLKAENAQTKAKEIENLRSFNNLQKEIFRQDFQASQEKIKQAGANYRAQLKLATGQDFDPTQTIDDAFNGKYSLTDLKRMFPEKPKLAAIVKGVQDAGGTLLDEKQKILPPAYSNIFGAFDAYDKFNELRSQHGRLVSGAGIPGTGFGTDTNQALQRLAAQVKEPLAILQTMYVKTGNRAGEARIRQMNEEFGPQISNSPEESKKNAEAFKLATIKAFNAEFNNLSQRQRNAMITRISEVEPRAIEAAKKVKVRHKGTGKIGYMPPNYNPETFEEVK